MNEIRSEKDFRDALGALYDVQQRQVAALFAQHVLPLNEDNRLERVIKTAADLNATDEGLAGALKTSLPVTFDSHARCGVEGHWSDRSAHTECDMNRS